MNTFHRIVAGWCLAVISTLAEAAPEPAMPVMSTLVSLVVVLVAIGAAAFLVKRLGRGNATEARLMRVVSQLALGAREKISIVELNDQWLVLGVTSQQVTLLAQTPRMESGATPPAAVNFLKLFNQARGKHDAP